MFPGGKNFAILSSPLDKNCRAILLPGFCTHDASSESDTSDSSSYSSLQGVAARPRRINLKGYMHVNVCTMCMSMYVINTICEDIMGSRAPTNYSPVLGLYGPLEPFVFIYSQIEPSHGPTCLGGSRPLCHTFWTGMSQRYRSAVCFQLCSFHT